MIGAEYQNDEGILDRNSRKNVGSANLFSPTTGDHDYILVRDVNSSTTSLGGLITSGTLKGQTFNSDGTLRAFQYGSQISGSTMVGGEGVATNDEYALTNPYQRVNSYARASFEVGDATFWADGSYSRIWAKYPFYAENGTYTLSASNPYLSQSIRDQLAAAGETSIKVGRFFEDYASAASGTAGEFAGSNTLTGRSRFGLKPAIFGFARNWAKVTLGKRFSFTVKLIATVINMSQGDGNQ